MQKLLFVQTFERQVCLILSYDDAIFSVSTASKP